MAAKPSRRKRNGLTLKQKYELIKESEKNQTPTTRELAGIYACGKTQVYQILKDKAAIIERYEANVTGNLRRSLKESRKSPYAGINDLLYQWFLVAVRKNIYPDGPTLCAQALEIAKHLQVGDFKVSNGWLEKWKARHIERMTISGESGEVSSKTADSWNSYQKLFTGTNLKMSGIWMRVDAFGKPCLIKGLPSCYVGHLASNDKREHQLHSFLVHFN